MKTGLLKSLAVVCVAVVASGPGHAQVVLSTSTETVAPGGMATVDLNVSGLGSGVALSAFDVNVSFNPALLDFTSASYGDPQLGDQLNLEGIGTFTLTTPSTGSVELAEFSFDTVAALTSSQATRFTLGTLSFDALAPGSSPLTLSINALGDQNGNALAAELQNGSVTIAAVPELDTGWLILAGVAGLALVTRMRRARVAGAGGPLAM